MNFSESLLPNRPQMQREKKVLAQNPEVSLKALSFPKLCDPIIVRREKRRENKSKVELNTLVLVYLHE